MIYSRARLALLIAETATLAVTLVACGGEGSPQETGSSGMPAAAAPFSPFAGMSLDSLLDARNGVERMSGPEALRAAAVALREAGSFRVQMSDANEPGHMDYCLERKAVYMTASAAGQKFERIWIDGYAYVRRTPPTNPDIPPGHWLKASGSPIFLIESFEKPLEEHAREGAVTVTPAESLDGWPVVRITLSNGGSYLISNAGPPVPLLARGGELIGGGEDDSLWKFSDYGVQCGIEVPSPTIDVRPGLEDPEGLALYSGETSTMPSRESTPRTGE